LFSATKTRIIGIGLIDVVSLGSQPSPCGAVGAFYAHLLMVKNSV
jgi:hypothetical protein